MTQAAPPAKTEEQLQADARAVADAHRTAAAASGSGQPEIKPNAPVKPEGVPDKFWNKDTGVVDYKAWGDAHAGLETQFHAAKKPEPPKPGEQPPAGAPPADERTAAIDAANAEFAKDGKLSDATYATLEKQGYARSMVDGYIAGQTAASSALASAAHGAAEGAANYTKMIEWAGSEEGLSEAEIVAFNAQLATKKPELIKAAVEGVYAKYKAVATVEGRRVGGGLPPSNGSVFANKDEHRAAMNEPSKTHKGKTRYETDAAYRQEVINKLTASRRAGINVFG